MQSRKTFLGRFGYSILGLGVIGLFQELWRMSAYSSTPTGTAIYWAGGVGLIVIWTIATKARILDIGISSSWVFPYVLVVIGSTYFSFWCASKRHGISWPSIGFPMPILIATTVALALQVPLMLIAGRSKNGVIGKKHEDSSVVEQ